MADDSDKSSGDSPDETDSTIIRICVESVEPELEEFMWKIIDRLQAGASNEDM